MSVERKQRPPEEIANYGAVQKSRTDDVVVALRLYNGTPQIDMRVFESRCNGAQLEKHSSHKGIVIRPEKLPELIDLLEKAQADAEMRGLL